MKTSLLHLISSDDSPSIVSIRRLEDFALPFSFDPSIFCTEAFFNSVLHALEDPVEGGCCPRMVLKILTEITSEARALYPSSSRQKTVLFKIRPGVQLSVITGILIPHGITVLAASGEESAMAEIGLNGA
jgi:hypothetical protein